jgi:ferritin-like metal-binding protein YciE
MARTASGNLGSNERLLSLLAGLGLTLLALRGRGFGRAAASAAGLSLLTRGATGHCAVKAAATGESTLKEGFKQQWNRARAGLGMTAAAQIDSLPDLFVAELQELSSAESQLSHVIRQLPGTLSSQDLESHLLGYATELQSRHEDLDRILDSLGVDPAEHPDDAMEALVREVRKMSQVSSERVRDAAVLSSIQRLIHFKIAGYGTVATYAKSLDRIEEAARLGEYADRDKECDQELTALAKQVVNPIAQETAPTLQPAGTQH